MPKVVRGGQLIDSIKACAEGKPDQAILETGNNTNPAWPWRSEEEFSARLGKAQRFGETRMPQAAR